VGLNPGTVFWMEVSHNASYYIKEKIKNKGSRMGHIKKCLKKICYHSDIEIRKSLAQSH
jgi:hypothetical protein